MAKSSKPAAGQAPPPFEKHPLEKLPDASNAEHLTKEELETIPDEDADTLPSPEEPPPPGEAP